MRTDTGHMDMFSCFHSISTRETTFFCFPGHYSPFNRKNFALKKLPNSIIDWLDLIALKILTATGLVPSKFVIYCQLLISPSRSSFQATDYLKVNFLGPENLL